MRQHVVNRDDAGHFVFGVEDRDGNQVILGQCFQHILRLGIDMHVFDVLFHDIRNQHFRWIHDQALERYDTLQSVICGDDIPVEDGFDLVGAFLENLQGPADGDVGGESQVVRVHQAARRILFVFQQFLDVFGIFLVHHVQQFLGLLLRKVTEYVGRFVRLHFFQDVGHLLVVQLIDDEVTHVRFEFVEGFAGGFRIDRIKHGADALDRNVFNDIGQVGRMHLVHLVAGNVERQFGGVGLQWLNVFPADLGVRDVLAERLCNRFPQSLVTQAPQQAAKSDVDREYAQFLIEVSQFDVVDPYDLGAVHIDNLLVQQVAFDEDLAFARCEGGEPGRAQPGDGNHHMGKECDLTPGKGFEPFAGLDDDMGYFGKYIAGNHDQIAQDADFIPLAVDDGAADDSTQVDFIEFSGHAVFPVLMRNKNEYLLLVS